ncbi:hypothetical protein [Rhodopirellula baltica]
MTTRNPYRSPAAPASTGVSHHLRSRKRWATIGFASGLLPSALFGAFGLYNESVYAASLPPGEVQCGMGTLAAMMFIFPVAPILGLIGAAFGWVAAIIA